MLTKSDLRHILEALDDAEVEFEELMNEREWFVTYVVDKLISAKQIVQEELESYDQVRTGSVRQAGPQSP